MPHSEQYQNLTEKKWKETPSILINANQVMSSQLDNKMGKTIKIPLCRNSAKIRSKRCRNRGNINTP